MKASESLVAVEAGPVTLEGFLVIPKDAKGLVVFVHGSGSSRHSPRNQAVAKFFNSEGLATLLFDLLTADEEAIDTITRHLRFDIPMLAERVVGAVDWVESYPLTQEMRIGLIGSSTGASAALVAAAQCSDRVSAVVSRGGRPDLAGKALPLVKAPTLLIVGANDFQVIELNEGAFKILTCEKKMELVPSATHLFEEPGTLEKASELANDWFQAHFTS